MEQSRAQHFDAEVSQNTVVVTKDLTGLVFAKIMHSALMIDLGNSHSPNLLLDNAYIANILNATDDPNRQPGGLLFEGLATTWYV